MWTGGYLDLKSPGISFIRAAGHLGWGFPAALGAKCGAPERPVILFTGDAGFWYHIGEIETAVRWGINAVILVNNNGSQNQETKIFKDAYGGEQHGKRTNSGASTARISTRSQSPWGPRAFAWKNRANSAPRSTKPSA